MDLCWQIMSLLLNMPSRLVLTFLPRSKRLNFIAAITIFSDFGTPQNKVWHCFPLQNYSILSTLPTSCEELTHWKRLWCWEGLGQEEKMMTEDEVAGWHHWLDGHESEWTPGVGDGQGGLVCCDSWGRKELDMTERLNWTESLITYLSLLVRFMLSFFPL